MSEKKQVTREGSGLAGMVFIVFLVLKLLGKITWSWWWVTAPLWGSAAVALAIIVVCVLIAGVITLVDK